MTTSTLTRRSFLHATAAPALAAGLVPPNAPQTRFTVRGDRFLLDGQPLQILSGDMHYARIPRSCWRDRLRKARALGLNTLCTYCFWNAHEPVEGRWDFSGNLDVHSWIAMAQEEGLHVILRPGPYVCAEWDFGGFPAWLLADPGMRVRSADPNFLQAVDRYFERLAREVVPLTIAQGGPIILCQIENEYGSYGDDPVYKNAIRATLAKHGFDGAAFYTSDGPSAVLRGSFPDLPAVINFGANEDPAKEFATLDKLRPGGPRMCGEFWAGWFDHWGETHNGMTTRNVCAGLEWMISRGISVNLYMLHGGTSFGFAAGANHARFYQPDVSNYDYDAPVDEAGVPTPKYFALREVIARHTPASAAAAVSLPEPEAFVTIPRFTLDEASPLRNLIAQPVQSVEPKPMEMLGQTHGALFYRTRIDKARQGTLEITEARDYALVFADGVHLGTLDRRLGQTRLPVKLQAGAQLDILVDTMGHVNFGPHLTDDRKGIVGTVSLDGQPLTDWKISSLPLDSLSGLQYSTQPFTGPAFYRGRFSLPSTGYTFLDTRGWGRGYMWVNGHNLGRYWSVGPQRTLFVPAEWLHAGENEVVVLDYHPGAERSLAGRKDAVYDIDPQGAQL